MELWKAYRRDSEKALAFFKDQVNQVNPKKK